MFTLRSSGIVTVLARASARPNSSQAGGPVASDSSGGSGSSSGQPGDPPTAEVTVTGTRPIDSYFAFAFNNALVDAFQRQVNQSIGYMVWLPTSPKRAAAIAKVQGALAVTSLAMLVPAVGIEMLTAGAAAVGSGGYSMALGLWSDASTGAKLLQPFADQFGAQTHG